MYETRVANTECRYFTNGLFNSFHVQMISAAIFDNIYKIVNVCCSNYICKTTREAPINGLQIRQIHVGVN